MGFVRITHTHPDVLDGVASEEAVPFWESNGWSAVDPRDVRQYPSDFDGELDPDAPQRPAKSASKADWVTYASSAGMTEGDAQQMTRDELVALYVPQED